MSLHVRQIDFFRTDMQTRFPFRYGIASMTDLPHLFVLARVEIDGVHCSGIAADGLPPKWFTKNPDTSFEDDDLPAMLRVIRHAADQAVHLGTKRSVFAWWRELYDAQSSWAKSMQIAPLLAGFGVSLMERAVIDAFCRRHQLTFFEALQENALAIELAAIRPELATASVSDFLPSRPPESIAVRHTVGLGDPLTDDQIAPGDRLDDGLPYSLESNIRDYGLRYFKIKLSGDLQIDRERLVEIAAIVNRHTGPSARFTLDGNEQFQSVGTFRDAWEELCSVDRLRDFFDRSLLFVEQPLHRDVALGSSVQAALEGWDDAPPIIIDESDSELESLPTALRLGYRGTSHKNCKGVIKGVAAAATMAARRDQGLESILSAEDLANVGPVALLQDLAVVSALGIEHVERNGHHYFAGLRMFSTELQSLILEDHPDLYRMTDRGFASLAVDGGKLQLGSIQRAPFGVARLPETALVERWEF